MNELEILVKKYKIASAVSSSKDYVDNLWAEYVIASTPMGSLILKDDFKSQLDRGEDVILLHVSSNIKQIKSDKILFSSGGGLGGVVYCTPIHSNGSVHNLTNYIINKELPNFIKSKSSLSNIGLIAIKIPSSLFLSNTCNVVEVNYIEFGKRYLSSYNKLLKEGKIVRLMDEQLKENLEVEFKNISSFLELFCPRNYEMSMAEFINTLDKKINGAEMILNCYFEVILEYFYMHQDDEAANHLKSKGELNNESVKDMIFNLAPDLYSGFSTRKFKVKPISIINYFNKDINIDPFIKNFSRDHFYLFMRWRLSYYIFFIMLDGAELKKGHAYSSDEIMECYPNLAGQLIYKIMQSKSHLMESEFSSNFLPKGADIKILSYKNIPKGELGLRINKINNDIKFFEAHIDNNKVVLDNEIDIKISNNLIDTKHSVMRDPTHSKNSRPLYMLAKDGLLGDLQIMDIETLDWIDYNSKDYKFDKLQKRPFLYKADLDVFKKYFPRNDWFLSQSHIKSIHGHRHIGRVSLFTLMICNRLSVSNKTKYTAFLASVVHDLRRLNDKQDIEHGNRAAQWFSDSSFIFSDLFKEIDINNVILAVKYHNYEISQVPDNLSDDCRDAINILKTADALDRYRQPKEKWWTNPNMLTVPCAIEFIELARNITLYSERQYINGIDSRTALLDSLIAVGVYIK